MVQADRLQPISEENAKVYTFESWLKEYLEEVDPGVIVIKDTLSRFKIMLNGSWHLATVYAPPEEILSGLIDQYPREIQTEMFRRVIFAINSWYHLSTDSHTGAVIPK